MTDRRDPTLVRSFCHEARNTMFVVLSNLEYLLAEDGDAERREVMEEARRAIKRLQRRVGELEAADEAPAAAAIDVLPVVRAAIDRSQATRVRLVADGAVPSAIDSQLLGSLIEGVLDVSIEDRGAQSLEVALERTDGGARIRLRAEPPIDWPRNEFLRAVLIAHGGGMAVAGDALVIELPGGTGGD
jgi:hypothetical protein